MNLHNIFPYSSVATPRFLWWVGFEKTSLVSYYDGIYVKKQFPFISASVLLKILKVTPAAYSQMWLLIKS